MDPPGGQGSQTPSLLSAPRAALRQGGQNDLSAEEAFRKSIELVLNKRCKVSSMAISGNSPAWGAKAPRPQIGLCGPACLRAKPTCVGFREPVLSRTAAQPCTIRRIHGQQSRWTTPCRLSPTHLYSLGRFSCVVCAMVLSQASCA